MNRIKISPLATASIEFENKSKPVHDVFNEDGSSVKTGDQLSSFPSDTSPAESECSLFVPLHYEKNYQYPLIVWLHNDGDDTEQLYRIMPSISLRNYVAVGPRAALGAEHHGFYWDQDQASIDYANDAVAAAIDTASMRTNIASNRIFIAGYGGAGTMAFRVAFDRPELFAGVISVNGPMPEGLTPLSRWSHSRELEVFWAHCRQSVEFGQERLCRQLKLLHVAGFSVTLRQYPGGDQLCESALADLNRWIMEMNDSTIS